ncbi:MAG: alkaline phosphatase family protein [Gemmatimonadaceae bacterium]
MPADIRSSPVQRVVLVVLDGLRPDAIARFRLHRVASLARRGASTFRAQTVSPSITPCAMASLLTGASPERHGMQSERFRLPRSRGPVHPLAKELARHSLPSSFFMPQVPFLMRSIAGRLATALGLGLLRHQGKNADEVLAAARSTLASQRRGLIVLHWLDADRAGHAHGWMSPEYGVAAERMDAALGALEAAVDLDDPTTLMIALADHGGGGATPKHHDSAHPLDTTIPLMLIGGAVVPCELSAGASLTDVPATILWALGLARPESYVGRPLLQAFAKLPMAA